MFTFRSEKKESEDQDEKPVQRDTDTFDTFDTPKEASDHSPRSQKPVPNQITIEWSNLRVTAKLPKKKICDGKQEENRKTILDGVDGIALPGTLTALMGSSGAGKTTLLNVLNRTGINNLEADRVGRNPREWKHGGSERHVKNGRICTTRRSFLWHIKST